MSTQKIRWAVTGATIRGASHLRTGLPNQDALQYWLADGTAAAAILAVSDGHGSAPHFRSQIGSALAVHTAVDVLKELVERGDELQQGNSLEESAGKIPQRIAEEW